MKYAEAIEWLEEAARYFDRLPTNGEDRAHWSNSYNAENARKIAAILRDAPSAASYNALADILERHKINSLDGVAVKTTLRSWAIAQKSRQ